RRSQIADPRSPHARLKTHQLAIALPEAADAGLGGTRTVGRGDIAAAHFEEGVAVLAAAGAALNNLVDAAVLQRNKARRTGQVTLHQPLPRLLFAVIAVAEIDPEQLGFVHAAWREEAHRQRVQGQLHDQRGKYRLDAVGNAVVELGEG